MSSDEVQGSLVGCVIKDMWVNIGTLLIVVDVCMIVAAIIFFPASYIVIKTKAQLSGKHSMRKRWMSMVRVLSYIGYYLLALIFGTTTTLWNYINKDEVAEGITKWVLCSINLEENCRDRYLYRMPYSWFLFQGSFFACAGTVIFLCFGTSDESIRWWKRTLQGEVTIWAQSTTTTAASNGTNKNTSASNLTASE